MAKKTSADLRREIAALTRRIQPMERRLGTLMNRLDKLRSQELVAKHGIRLADVVLSEGEDRPYFAVDTTFIRWIHDNGLENKLWVEWNDSVYAMKDFLSGKISYENSLIRIEDVKE